MTIKLKLYALQAAVPALSALGSAKLPAKAAYSVAKVLRAAQSELSLFEEQRNKLIKELGTEDKAGNFSVAPGSEAMARFQAEIKPLLDTEIEIAVNPLPLSVLERAELSAHDLMALDAFITEEEPANG